MRLKRQELGDGVFMLSSTYLRGSSWTVLVIGAFGFTAMESNARSCFDEGN